MVHEEIKKYFFVDFFSAYFWQRTLRENQIAMKSFTKNLSFKADFSNIFKPNTYKRWFEKLFCNPNNNNSIWNVKLLQ